MDDFIKIFETNSWSGKESRSGPGSSIASTRELTKWLLEVVERRNIKSVLDAPCGDGNWFPDLPAEYTGMDLVPAAIEMARQRHPDRSYSVHNLITDPIEWRGDLIFSRDFMQHLTVVAGQEVLKRFKETGARYLAISHYADGTNYDPRSHWHAYRVNLVAPPFELGPPLEMVDDGYDEQGKHRDLGKKMGLWELNRVS